MNKIFPYGRKNIPRDNTKLRITNYLFEVNDNNPVTTYELLHHARISVHDYAYLKKILNELTESQWLESIFSKTKSSKRVRYTLTDRGRELILFIRTLPDFHPLRDLDTFYGM